MDGLELVSGTIEQLIAAIPQIVLVLTTLVYALRSIGNKVGTYPKIANETKSSVDLSLAGIKTNLDTSLSAIKAKIEGILSVSQERFITTLEASNNETQNKISKTLATMETELTTYKNQLATNIEQTNLLSRQNKIFMDVILELVAKDPIKVSQGITQAVSTKINLTKEELEKYPEILVKDKKVLESALQEAYKLMGKVSFEKLLKNIGYGKENN
jgi:hypothetical protein